MLREILEQLFEFAAKAIPSDQILEAKKAYQKETGEIYEDDKSYNSRMALFLEWYLFDDYITEKAQTPLEILIEENPDAWNRDKLEIYKSIPESIQGLFLVKKIKDETVKVLNLFTDETYLAQEKDSRLIFGKNDIFQGRLIFFQEQFHFTGNFCFHPEKTHKYIKQEVKIINKAQAGDRKDLTKLKKKLLKENKNLESKEAEIEKLNKKISNTDSENKITKLNQKLSLLIEERNSLNKTIQDMESSAYILEHDKIRIEGNKQINKLINKLAYMNLKLERSRQIDISDIYKN
ncbi:MAG: hypothetical protein HOD90_08505 [Nitrospina sp.]|jgi:hypothetical protein|nr:hypothetical protein [Nitrospina sp.]